MDPSRPAWMYGGNTFYIPFEPVTGPRYWVPYQVKNLAERRILSEDDLRPSFMDEYLAATGNGLGGLDEYWELIWRYPRLMGGAIWDWISPGVTNTLWTTPDASSFKNHGAIMGRPEFVEGHTGRGLAFTGHDDWVEFYRNESLDITGDELTISFWVNPTKIPQPNTFITKGKNGYGIQMNTPKTIEFYISQNNLEDIHQSPYYENEAQRISATTNIPLDWYGNWHHVAGIYNGSTLKLFIDKQLVADTALSGNIAHTPFALCIGRDAETQDQGEHSGRLSSMIIDEVKVFNKALPMDAINSEEQSESMVLSLAFEEDVKGEEYFNVGLGGRTYGIVWPDRELQPEIHQIKKSGQPITVELVNVEKGIFKVINRHHFKNLSDFNFSWELLLEGKPIEEGKIDIFLAAQSEQEIVVPYTKPEEQGELILTTYFNLKEATNWAPAGHEIAFDQYIISEKSCIEALVNSGEIEVEETDKQVVVKGNDFTYTINKEKGQLSSLSYSNFEYLEKGPIFNIWRVPTANDIDPWGSYVYYEKKKTPGQGRSIDNQLRTLGMRDLQVQVDKIEARQKNNTTVEIIMQKYCNSSNMRGSFECLETYTFQPDGSIDIHLQVIPHGVMPDMLPKIGWQFELPKSMQQVKWYGRGLFETYPDRKTGAKIGLYESDIDLEYVPYIIPQDYGNHTDVRWVELKDDKGHGLRFKSSGPLLNFSFHKFSTENLSRAYYIYQLEEAKTNILNIDFEVSGVGGTAVRQLEKYRVKPEIKEYNFSIKTF